MRTTDRIINDSAALTASEQKRFDGCEACRRRLLSPPMMMWVLRGRAVDWSCVKHCDDAGRTAASLLSVAITNLTQRAQVTLPSEDEDMPGSKAAGNTGDVTAFWDYQPFWHLVNQCKSSSRCSMEKHLKLSDGFVFCWLQFGSHPTCSLTFNPASSSRISDSVSS